MEKPIATDNKSAGSSPAWRSWGIYVTIWVIKIFVVYLYLTKQKRMIGYIISAVIGAIAALLIVRVNPSLAAYFYKVADKVEDKIEKETGKNI